MGDFVGHAEGRRGGGRCAVTGTLETGSRRIEAPEALSRLREAAGRLDRAVTFMEVCGTHTVSAFRSGLHGLLPPNVKLLSGPGCPVCVTSQGDIDSLISLAGKPLTLCTYGDMMRVTGSEGSLMEARARGGDVRIVYSALDAVELAAGNPGREVVFAAVGFETTAPATALAVLEAEKLGLGNFSVFASHKLIMPAMHALLNSGELKVDGFVLPGHVAVITGSRIFEVVVEKYGMACVISGFEGEQIAAALAFLTEQLADGRRELVNLYPQAVDDAGNVTAQQALEKVFTPVSARWRGLAELPESGLGLREEYARFDAVRKFALPVMEDREPKGCRCGDVITGRCTPVECKLFGRGCTPVNAIGPCMVSSEGTCAAWFKYGRGAK
jgi:hydrogenase expression/formation protein HypD